MGLQQLAGGDGAVGYGHLQGRDENVTLADDHVRHVAALPHRLFGRVAEMLQFPFRRGNDAHRFATEIDVGRQFGIKPDNRIVVHVDLTVTVGVHLFVLGSIHLIPEPFQMFRTLY
mgnify:CR=1 FL=1